MKKIVFFVIMLTFCFISGCDDMEDMVDFEVRLTETEAVPGIGGTGTYSVDVDLTDDSDYNEYKGYIKDISIKAMSYRVSQNLGSAGSFTFYVAPISDTPNFADAVQVTEAITFDRGITTEEWQTVTFTENKGYFEDLLLDQRKFTIWVDLTADSTAAVEVILKFDIKITANFLEKI